MDEACELLGERFFVFDGEGFIQIHVKDDVILADAAVDDVFAGKALVGPVRVVHRHLVHLGEDAAVTPGRVNLLRRPLKLLPVGMEGGHKNIGASLGIAALSLLPLVGLLLYGKLNVGV